MAVYPKPLRRLVALLSRLPGIGEKTATRLSMFLLKMPPSSSASWKRDCPHPGERDKMLEMF